jgi:hypothetical protein
MAGVRLSPHGMPATREPTVPAPDGRLASSNGWNENWLGKPKYSGNPVIVSLYPPQIPYDLTWDGIRPIVMRTWWLSAWAMTLTYMANFEVRPSQKVTALISDEVTGFFNWPNLFSRSMTLGLTQSLTEMTNRSLLGPPGHVTGIAISF